MSTEIRRYRMGLGEGPLNTVVPRPVKHCDGEWVRWADVEALLAPPGVSPRPSTEERKPKRYDLVTNYRAGSSIEEMEPADDGEWVRYEDVASIQREVLVKADSYLSLLWYRPSTPRDTELQLEVPRVIAALRKAYEQAPGAVSLLIAVDPIAAERPQAALRAHDSSPTGHPREDGQ